MESTKDKRNPCDTCSAGHDNGLYRVFVRCGTCKVVPNGLPSNYRPAGAENEARRRTM